MTPAAFTKFSALLGPKRAADMLGLTDPGLRYVMKKEKLRPVDELRLLDAMEKVERLLDEIRQS